ncbi:unnamed protein product [Symbiodinium sp. CCMP2592]|nr:unnamed protein product [Symbiodinium sp. CCMP2592]
MLKPAFLLVLPSLVSSEPAEVCCFKKSDILSRSISSSVDVLIVDNFFCKAFLDFARKLAEVFYDQGWFESTSTFPGTEFYFNRLQEEPELYAKASKKVNEGMLGIFLRGEYLECLGRAALETGFSLTPNWRAPRSYWDAAGIFSMQNQPPNVSLVHVDWEYAVVNIHLSTAFNDTGTAFYKSKRGSSVCMEETALHQCLRDFEEQDAYHRLWGGHGQDHCGLCSDRHLACEKWAQSGNCVADPGSMHLMCPHSCGTCAGLWPGPAVPRREDHAGLFELVHVEEEEREQNGQEDQTFGAESYGGPTDAAAWAESTRIFVAGQSSSTPPELAASVELASATTAEEPAASISSGAPGFPAQQVLQEEDGYDSEQIASNRHKHEASPETATAICGATAATTAARHGRARAGKSAAPETREEDLDLLLDIEAALGQELPAAPTRRRRSEPWARLRPQRQGGFSSLSDVPDVPVGIDGSAAAGGLDPEDVLATCPDAMTEEEGVQLESCDAGEERWDRSESDSESLGLPLTLEEGPWIRGLDFEALDTSDTNSPQEQRGRGGGRGAGLGLTFHSCAATPHSFVGLGNYVLAPVDLPCRTTRGYYDMILHSSVRAIRIRMRAPLI